jgi:hypothetical protein
MSSNIGVMSVYKRLKTFIGLEQIVALCGSRTSGAESIMAVAMYK